MGARAPRSVDEPISGPIHEVVHAVVVLAEGADIASDELIAHCRGQLAGYKCPRSTTFRREPMPLSPANKILKSELRKQVLGQTLAG
jgi:acyl-CoA synthetase (AMP-forming)/AMP-acid ligase II